MSEINKVKVDIKQLIIYKKNLYKTNNKKSKRTKE